VLDPERQNFAKNVVEGKVFSNSKFRKPRFTEPPTAPFPSLHVLSCLWPS
jgi:hypothetical protein